MLGVRHPIHLEGVGAHVLPFAVMDASLHLEVVLQFDARGSWRNDEFVLGKGGLQISITVKCLSDSTIASTNHVSKPPRACATGCTLIFRQLARP